MNYNNYLQNQSQQSYPQGYTQQPVAEESEESDEEESLEDSSESSEEESEEEINTVPMEYPQQYHQASVYQPPQPIQPQQYYQSPIPQPPISTKKSKKIDSQQMLQQPYQQYPPQQMSQQYPGYPPQQMSQQPYPPISTKKSKKINSQQYPGYPQPMQPQQSYQQYPPQQSYQQIPQQYPPQQSYQQIPQQYPGYPQPMQPQQSYQQPYQQYPGYPQPMQPQQYPGYPQPMQPQQMPQQYQQYPGYSQPKIGKPKISKVSSSESIVSKSVSNDEFQRNPELFIDSSVDAFRNKNASEFERIKRKDYNMTIFRSEKHWESKFSMGLKLKNIRKIEEPYYIQSLTIQDIIDECLEKHILLPYFLLTKIKNQSEALRILNLPNLLSNDITTLITQWCIHRRNAFGLLQWDTPAEETIEPIEISPGTKIVAKSNKMMNTNTLMRNIIINPEALIKSTKNIQLQNQANSIGINQFANIPSLQQYKTYFESCGSMSFLSGLIKVFNFQLQALVKNVKNVNYDKEIRTVLERVSLIEIPRFNSVQEESDYRNRLNTIALQEVSNKYSPYSWKDLEPIVQIAKLIFNSKNSKLGITYISIYLKFIRVEDDKVRSEEISVLKFSDTDEGIAEALRTIAENENNKLPITIRQVINAAGYDKELDFEDMYITGEVVVKGLSYIRGGGNNGENLVKIFSLMKNSMIYDEINMKNIEKFAIGSKFGFRVTLPFGTAISYPSRNVDGCFFTCCAYNKSFNQHFQENFLSKTKTGKSEKVTENRIFKEYVNAQKIDGNNVTKDTFIDIDTATRVALLYGGCLLRIIDEKGYQINNSSYEALIGEIKNSGVEINLNDPKIRITFILYENHYFNCEDLHEDMLVLTNEVEFEEKSKKNKIGYEVVIDVLVYFDFETIYKFSNDMSKINNSVEAYSLSFKAKVGGISVSNNIKSTEDKAYLISRCEDAFDEIKEASLPVRTIFEPEGNSIKLIGLMTTAVKSMFATREISNVIIENILSLKACHGIINRYTFIAFNGAKFDFIPLLSYFIQGNFYPDSRKPIKATGRISEMEFRDSSILASAYYGASDQIYKYVHNDFRVWDPRCFVNGSLESSSKSFGCKTSKGELNHVEIQNKYETLSKDDWYEYLESMHDKITDYNNQDVEVLEELVEKISKVMPSTMKTINENQISPMFSFGTLPALSYNYLSKTLIIPRKLLNVCLESEGIKHLEDPCFIDEYSTSMKNMDVFYSKYKDSLLDAVKGNISSEFKTICDNYGIAQPATFSSSVKGLPNKIDNEFRKGLVAGRCSSEFVGIDSSDEEKSQLDVTSLYPYVCSERLFPIGEHRYITLKDLKQEWPEGFPTKIVQPVKPLPAPVQPAQPVPIFQPLSPKFNSQQRYSPPKTKARAPTIQLPQNTQFNPPSVQQVKPVQPVQESIKSPEQPKIIADPPADKRIGSRDKLFFCYCEIDQTKIKERYPHGGNYFPERLNKNDEEGRARFEEEKIKDEAVTIGRLRWNSPPGTKIRAWIPTITIVDLINMDIDSVKYLDPITGKEARDEDTIGVTWDEAGYIFTPYVNFFSIGKKEEDDKPEEERNAAKREMCKLSLNAPTGKVIQKKHLDSNDLYMKAASLTKKIEELEKKGLDIGIPEIYQVENTDASFVKLPKFYDEEKSAQVPAHIGIFIYAYARSYMWNTIFKHTAYRYTDTDSAIPNASYIEVLKKYDLMGKRFGKFGIDGIFDKISIISPKYYYLRRKDTPELRERFKKYVKNGRLEPKVSTKGISMRDTIISSDKHNGTAVKQSLEYTFNELSGGRDVTTRAFQFRKDLKKSSWTYNNINKVTKGIKNNELFDQNIEVGEEDISLNLDQ